MLSNLYPLNKCIVDHIQKEFCLVDEVEVALLSLVREGNLDEVLLILLVFSNYSIYLLNHRWLEKN